MRLLGLVLAVCASFAQAQPAVLDAAFAEPTTRYQHGVFGKAEEWGALVLSIDLCPACARLDRARRVLRLPLSRVFEDIAPRLVDLNGDHAPEVVVVETDITQGARLSVYGADGLIAATPFIGRTNRWLAPAGFGDFNGDGRTDIAYIETPHLGRLLRIFTLEGTELREIAQVSGITNHRFGDPAIRGGVRDCGTGPEVVGASPDWQRVLVARLEGARITLRDAGALTSPAALDDALTCP
ncbi:MAG: VCBS repeat-containing protein [Paracoccaceae bacterium]